MIIHNKQNDIGYRISRAHTAALLLSKTEGGIIKLYNYNPATIFGLLVVSHKYGKAKPKICFWKGFENLLTVSSTLVFNRFCWLWDLHNVMLKNVHFPLNTFNDNYREWYLNFKEYLYLGFSYYLNLLSAMSHNSRYILLCSPRHSITHLSILTI